MRRVLVVVAWCCGLLSLGCAHGQRVSSAEETWISPGNAYVGETDQKNSAGEGKPVVLRYRGTAGQRVRFKLETRKGEVLRGGVEVVRSSGEKVETKDEEEAKTDDVRIESALLPATEDYEVHVFTGDLFFGHFGSFRLEFLPITTPPVLDLEVGKPLTGTLSETDRTDLTNLGERVDLYRLALGSDATRYTFIAKSAAFQPSVWVYRDGLSRDPENQFGGAEHTSTVKGEIFVAVAAQGEAPATGDYTLEVRDTRAHEMATLPVLELGARHAGTLAESGPDSIKEFKVRGVPGVVYVIDARSADFDVALLITNNHPRFSTKFQGTMDDDGAGGTNARLRFKFPDREEWVLRVVSQGDDASGSYTVQFNTDDKAPAIDPADKAHMIKGVKRPVRELHAGTPVSALLEAGTGAPKYAGRDVYMFHGQEQQAVTLTLDAPDFDAVVSVTQLGAKEPLGAATARKGSSAKLELTLPKPARADYLIQVEPLTGQARGRYTLERK